MEGWNGEGADEVPAVILWAFSYFAILAWGLGSIKNVFWGHSTYLTIPSY